MGENKRPRFQVYEKIFSMRNFYLFSVIQIVVSAEKTCSNSFRNETIDCSDDEPQGKSVMVIYNDVTTSRPAQRIPYKAFLIKNSEVSHFNIEMNGFELDDACAVTMNGQTYIFKAEKQSERYGKKYVLLLDPNSRDLRFYSKMKDLDRISTCSKWSPGAFGPSKYKNKNKDVALLCFTVPQSSQCWIYDDFKKKFRKFRAKTKFGHTEARLGYYQGEPFILGSDYP